MVEFKVPEERTEEACQFGKTSSWYCSIRKEYPAGRFDVNGTMITSKKWYSPQKTLTKSYKHQNKRIVNVFCSIVFAKMQKPLILLERSFFLFSGLLERILCSSRCNYKIFHEEDGGEGAPSDGAGGGVCPKAVSKVRRVLQIQDSGIQKIPEERVFFGDFCALFLSLPVKASSFPRARYSLLLFDQFAKVWLMEASWAL